MSLTIILSIVELRDKIWNEDHKSCELEMRLRDIDEQLENIKASRECEETMVPCCYTIIFLFTCLSACLSTCHH